LFTAFSQVPYSATTGSEPTQGLPTEGEAVTAPTNSQTASGTTAHYPQTAAESGSPAAGPTVAAPPRRRSVQVVALVAAGALLGGTGGVAAGVALHNDSPGTPAALSGSSAPVVSPSGMSTGGRSTSAVAAAVLPSVVVLQVSGSGQSDTGSGVVLSGDGYLLTNNHVVAAASSGGTIRATFNDGTSAAARIVGTDPASDLAVVKVARSGLRAATLGSSATLKVGDPVLAIGSPLGLSGTVTSGIVSALDRPVSTGGSSGRGGAGAGTPAVLDAIQTDAAINPGNSGGPLVDLAGQVIGVNSAIASLGSSASGSGQSGNIGVGFAIPVDQAKVIAGQLIATGHASHAVLGVSVTNVAAADGSAQAQLRQVAAGGPAAKAGLAAGDVVTAVGATAITSTESLIATVRTHQPGDKIALTYHRGGAVHTVTVTLADASSIG